MTKIRFEIFVLLFCGSVFADHVPVFIWGSQIQYEPASALTFHSGDDFIDIVRRLITYETVTLIIAENQLSTETLSQCQTENGSCFQGIQRIKDKRFLSNVKDPVAVMIDIAGTDKIEINLSANGSLSKNIDTLPSYVFIGFEEFPDGGSESSMFMNHDRFIMKLYDELTSKNQRLLVIYTGKESVRRQRREINDSQSSPEDGVTRANKTEFFWKRDQFLMYYTDFHIMEDSRNGSLLFDEVTANDAGTTIVHRKDRTEIWTQMNVTMTVTESKDVFWFTIIGKNGYWWMNESTWNDEKLFQRTGIAAVYNQSFHCTPKTELFTLNRTVVIGFTELNFQPQFNSSKDKPLEKFGNSWDCVYFFSPGILSGVLIVFLMLFVVFVAISFMLDIKTNDRYNKTKKEPNFNAID